MDYGLLENEVCNRDGCKGEMKEVDDGGCCSCHIHPPCSHCTDAVFECSECSFLVEPPIQAPKKSYVPLIVQRETTEESFGGLKGDSIEWIDITPGDSYYFEVKKGKYPDGTTYDQIKEKFNLCFGYKYLKMKDGVFEIKYYTD